MNNDLKNFNKTVQPYIGFIGCGKMASAIIQGVLNSGFVSHSHIIASEVNEELALSKQESLKIDVLTDNKVVAKTSDVIFLATKPNYIKDVLEEIKEELNDKKLIVSIAAGVSTKTIEEAVGKEIAVIRVMPNGPALILEGMSGIVKGSFATKEHVEFIQEFLSNIGKCLVVEEDKIDVLTAISGSGPAFFYHIINDMARAGEKLGLDYEKSLMLAAQTAIGSAKLMIESDLFPEELIKNIATNGGCTQVGVNYLEEQNIGELLFETIKKTAEKARTLG